MTHSVYLGYSLGGDPMQTGFARDYLPSDPCSSNTSRYLYRASESNARGQITTARYGSGDRTFASQLLVSEYDDATGWLLSRCSGAALCGNVLPEAVASSPASTLRLGYGYDVFGNVERVASIGKRPVGVSILANAL